MQAAGGGGAGARVGVGVGLGVGVAVGDGVGVRVGVGVSVAVSVGVGFGLWRAVPQPAATLSIRSRIAIKDSSARAGCPPGFNPLLIALASIHTLEVAT